MPPTLIEERPLRDAIELVFEINGQRRSVLTAPASRRGFPHLHSDLGERAGNDLLDRAIRKATTEIIAVLEAARICRRPKATAVMDEKLAAILDSDRANLARPSHRQGRTRPRPLDRLLAEARPGGRRTVGALLVRGRLTVVAARGGKGKTTLTRTLMAHGAAGREFLGFEFAHPLTWAYYSAREARPSGCGRWGRSRMPSAWTPTPSAGSTLRRAPVTVA